MHINMLFELDEFGIVICAHAASAPTDAEWRAYLKLCENNMAALRGFFVLTDGGGPTVAQRRWIGELWLGKRPPPTVVISESPVVRGIIAALRWFNSQAE